MTIYDFNRLDEPEQLKVIKAFGIEICKRSTKTYEKTVYNIDSFYAEKWFHIEQQVIKRIRPFRNPDLLEPYLREIDISGII